MLLGDLHRGNILAAEQEPWLVIDPRGQIGERAYETAAFLMNPLPEFSRRPDLVARLEGRATHLAAALGLDRSRIVGWGIVHAVLSACWDIEDHQGRWEASIAIAAALAGNL